MIKSCLFSRAELVDMIQKAPKTHDGYYFFPRFLVLVMEPGKIRDSGFFYDRSIFADKMCFNDQDIKIFLAKKKMKIDLELNRFIDIRLKDVLKGIEFLNLKDTIPQQTYSLEELIDTTIYLVKYKYS